MWHVKSLMKNDTIPLISGTGKSKSDRLRTNEREKVISLIFLTRILPALPHGDTLHHQPSAPEAHGCVIHSFIHRQCRSSERSLIEYCSLGIPIEIGENSILSNITLLTSSKPLKLPSNLIIQTIPLLNERYATFAFDFHCQMKKTFVDLREMKYFQRSISDLADEQHCQVENLFDHSSTRSLWTLKIFPVMKNPNESFEQTLHLINREEKSHRMPSDQKYVSIQEILQQRDISALIQYRSNLINCT